MNPGKCLHLVRGPALALAFGLAMFAQGPINDKLIVTFSNPVTVGDTTLAPGEYRIHQVPTVANPRILVFTTNDGTEVKASVSAIPALKNRTASDTSVILEQRGSDYYLSKIWIGGKNYGYEFVPGDGAPVTAQARQPETLALTATYQPEQPVVAQVTQPEPAPAPEPAPEPQPAPAPAPEPEPQPAPAPAPEPAPEPQPAPVTQTPSMPATATDWGNLGFAGILLAAAGLALNRLRS